MKIIRGLYQPIPAEIKKGTVATMGKFDGVHLGHQVIIQTLKEKSHLLKLPSVVILFEPHPAEFFQPGKTEARLMRLREKLAFLQSLSVDYVFIIKFNREFSELSATDFFNKILKEKLNIRHFIVGEDCFFGKNRQGDIAFLKAREKEGNFIVDMAKPFFINQYRVSSSVVRQALMKGDLALAEQLLGRPYCLSGRVTYGQQRGRTIDFPTANIHLHRAKSPVLGVYAVRMHGIAAQPLNGVANVGSRPTVEGTRVLLEVFLFDFDRDIYGCYVQVEILHKLRDEKKYDSFDLLKEQIKQDVKDAEVFFDRI